MSIVTSCQVYPTTFLDSFHGARLQILRYGSTIPFKNYNFYITHSSLNSVSNPDKYPQKKKPYFVPQNKTQRPNFDTETPISSVGISSSTTWMGKWNNTHYLKLPKRPQALLDYRNGGGGGDGVSSDEEDDLISYNSNSSSSGSTAGSSTMERIVEKLKKFGYVDNANERKEKLPERGSVEDIFYVEEGMLPNARGGFSENLPLGETGFEGGVDGEIRFPWEKPMGKSEEEERRKNSVRRRSKTAIAELTIPESELRRLRHLSIRTKPRTKIGGAGVTQAIVDVIHEKWKAAEIVRIKCEGPPALNMKRMHEILERKTGGLVIWRSGTSLSLYRGVSYELPSSKQTKKQIKNTTGNSYVTNTDIISKDPVDHTSSHSDVHLAQENFLTSVDQIKVKPVPEVSYEHEIDKLLECLGQRYTDWPGGNPLPVDADLLPGVVPGYQPPFRILPYGVKPSLGLKEMTALRRLARVLPPHFAVGRSRQHQGLAMAMVKLWEKSSIAKVALKRGVQLTTSERMAEDIKKLTGGRILSRNKDFIVFYRGKDFLSPEMTDALVERERSVNALQDTEEQARLRAASFVIPTVETTEESGTAGTLGETLEADTRWGKKLDNDAKNEVMRAAEVAGHANLVRKLEMKLTLADRKLMKAERALAKVEMFLKPAERSLDPESISDEERFMFRKIGLRMKAYLLLGRRGVFDGTVENMHLHWKYRELVKVLVKAKSFDQVKKIALSLEAESGGVLVSVDKVSKGFAIIVFRGRDYKRPSYLRPKNLLTKRKALARSIELQRHEALDNHISALKRRVELLRSELNQMENIKDQGDEELYAKLDSSYSTEEDDDTEDESDEAYLETYDSENESDVDESIFNLHSVSNSIFDDHQQESWDTEVESSSSYGAVDPNESSEPREAVSMTGTD